MRADYKISVVIPVYNREKLLSNALKSCLNQTTEVFEIIVVDDGSNDNTKEVVMNFANKFTDNNIHYIYQSNSGAQVARNKGIEFSTGDLIVFLDSDDILTNNSVECRLEYFIKNPNLGFVYGNFANTDLKFQKLSGYCYKDILKNLSLCPFSSIMASRKKIIEIGYLSEEFPAWQDDDFVLSMSKNYEIDYCDDNVAAFAPLTRNDNISLNYRSAFIGCKLLIEKYHNEIYNHFGYKYILLWKLRLFAIYLKLIAFKTKHKLIKSTLILFNRIVIKFLSPFFYRIYA
jgi:glycosyltransferase involved in cell wall biosynthesis